MAFLWGVPAASAITPSPAPRASCASGVTAASPGQYRPLILGGLNTNLYGISSATGQVSECPTGAGVSTSVDLDHVAGSGKGPLGYPEIAYGDNLIDHPAGAVDPSLALPAPVSYFDADNVWSSVRFQLGSVSPNSLGVDLAYDLWVEQDPIPGHRPTPDDLEVMLWLDHSPTMAASSVGGTLGEVSSTAIVNGALTETRWNVSEGRGGTGAPLVSFVLDPTQPSGSIAVRLSQFVDLAVRRFSPQLTQSGQVMGVELGTEFDRAPSSPISWAWSVGALDLCTGSATVPVVGSTSGEAAAGQVGEVNAVPDSDGTRLSWQADNVGPAGLVPSDPALASDVTRTSGPVSATSALTNDLPRGARSTFTALAKDTLGVGISCTAATGVLPAISDVTTPSVSTPESPMVILLPAVVAGLLVAAFVCRRRYSSRRSWR